MLAGPSLSNCFNSEDGMGICLRGKMVDAGILPQPAVAIAEPVAAPAAETPAPAVAGVEPQVAAVEPDVAIAEPELDVTPPAATATAPTAPESLIAATFGLLRAEPDGSVVIAGSGTPGSEVEVYSNDQLLGKAKVEASGDWVLVPDAPIPPGGTELTLAEAGKPGRAAESFVVVVNDDKSSEPLVVASTPGAASDILQGLKRPAAGTSTEVATANAAVTPSAVAAPETSQPTADPTRAAPEPVAETATPPAVEPANEIVPPAPEAAPPAAEVTAPPASDVAATAPDATVPPVAEAPVAEAPAATETPQPTVAAADPVVPPATQPEVTLASVPPTIDAIEIEGDKSFFAGGGPVGAVIRLYVDGKYIADAAVADGRWLIEAGKVLTKPNQRIRIDMLKPGTADVAARAEVDFKVELPTAQPTVVAEAEPAKPGVADEPAAAAARETASAAEVAELAAPAEPPAAEDKSAPLDVSASVAPVAVHGDKSVETANRASAAEDGAPVKLAEQSAAAIDNASKPATAPAIDAAEPEVAIAPEADKPLETAKAETTEPTPAGAVLEPAAPVAVAEPATPPAAEPETPAAAVAAPAQLAAPAAPAIETAQAAPLDTAPAEDVPTIVAVAVGDPETARFASGKAIIRRGDNLWTIAKRVYGAGIKYTTIYEANTGQIRNPNQIYPGQVFELPNN